jgi:uncharacterized protein (TIRG00374 family)
MTKQRIMILVTLIALAIVIFTNVGRFHQFLDALHAVRWYILIGIVFVQLLSYYANAKYYQSFFAIYNYQLSTKRLFKAALSINFVNQIFPSAGVSGASYLTRILAKDVPAGKTTLAQLMRYGFTFVSYIVILALGFFMLFLSKNLNPVTVRLTLLLILGIIVLGIIVAVLASDRDRLKGFASGIVRLINRVGNWFRSKKKKSKPIISDKQLDSFIDEFYYGYETLTQEKGHWKWPTFYSLLGSIAEILTIFVVFLAFGRFVNPGAIIVAYTLANVLSLVSPITGGAGVYEATMITTLVALGIPFAVAFSGVIVYRFFNFALFLPVGFFYYRQGIEAV